MNSAVIVVGGVAPKPKHPPDPALKGTPIASRVCDLLLGALHIDAIVTRQSWCRMPLNVLPMPLAIVVATMSCF